MLYETPEAPPSGLRLETSSADDATIVRCCGDLTMEHSPALGSHVKGMIPNAKRIFIDLQEVNRMDSSGLGAIVGLYISARKAKCELILVNYNKSIRNLLGLTNLLSVFEVCGQVGRFP